MHIIRPKDIELLGKYGYLNLTNVPQDQINKVDASHVKHALDKFNEFNDIKYTSGNASLRPQLVNYNSVSVSDTTINLLRQERCGVSDNPYAINDIAEANWPESCRFNLGIFVDWDDFPNSGMGISLQEAKTEYNRALNKWNSVIGINMFMVDTASHSDRKCSVDFDNLSGSTLAWSNLATNSCSNNKQQRYDIRNWSPLMFYKVAIHELGHLIGLQHKSGPYIMNPSIQSGVDDLTSNDIERAKQLGYSEPTNPNPNPIPPVPTPIPPVPGPTPSSPFKTEGSIEITYKPTGAKKSFYLIEKIDY